jgi:cell division protease FtsH
MFVGVGASRVRRLFETAQENKPCIIFIDEIDAIGRQRGAGFAGGNDEREQTLNQILTNMDGFNKEDGIIVLAATNRADILDNALTRPGRFDRKVSVGLPDINGRKKIMDVHFRDKKLAPDVDFDELSALTSGFSGADIANLANEAAILSVRYNEPYINKKCVIDAFEKVTIGLPKNEESREQSVLELVAYHEAGHTVMVKLFNEFFDLRKVTITSNQNGAGGYTLFTPKERYASYPTKKFMLANLIVALGGRAAEVELYKKEDRSKYNYSDELLFPNIDDLQITTGASNDLKQANSIARRYVSLFGLGKQIGVYDGTDSNQPFLGRDITSGSNNKISEYTKTNIDKEVEELVEYAYEKALDILKYNNDDFNNLGKMLLEKKVVDSQDMMSLKIAYHESCDNAE